MAKRLTIADIIDMDLSKVGAKDIDKLAKQFAKKASDRIKSFANKKNKNVYSPAVEKIKERYQGGIPNTEGMNFQQKQKLIYNIQDFFRSRTSDVSEARKIAREQDARLFGEDVFGQPKYRMSKEQRDAFWSAYDEFLNQNPTLHDESDSVLQVLAEMVEDGTLNRKGGFKALSKIGVLNEMRKRIDKAGGEVGGMSDYKIFTIDGIDF